MTSPGSPDLHQSQSRSAASRYSNRLTPGGPIAHENFIGGKLQIKLGYETSNLQLILTIICAAELRPRSNGAPRNPYAKV